MDNRIKVNTLLELLSGMRLAVRQVPVLPGFEHHTAALVDDSDGEPGIELSARPVEIRQIASSATSFKDAVRLLTEKELTARRVSAVGDSNITAVGVSFDKDSAKSRAVISCYEKLVSTLLASQNRLTLAAQQTSPTVRELKNIAGKVIVRSYTDVVPVPVRIIESVFDRRPNYLAAVGCGDDAEHRAKDMLLSKFDAFRLPRTGSAPWIDMASINYNDERVKKYTDSTERLDAISYDITPHIYTRTWKHHGIWVSEAKMCNTPKGMCESILSEVDAIHIGLLGPTEFSMTHGRHEVLASRIFHERSKIYVDFKDLPVVSSKRTAAPIVSTMRHATRDYRFTKREYVLSDTTEVRTAPFKEIIGTRRSWTPFGNEAIGYRELSHILYAAYGITGTGFNSSSNTKFPLRATPSGGGLYSNDIFVLVENVSTIDRGLYYLNPNKNCLQLVNEDARMAYACKLTGYSERISSSAVLVLLGASLRRNQWKYWERGYRTVLLDCGHLAQSIIVAAGSVGLVAHPIGGFIDDLVNEFVGYDGVDDVVLHLIALGSKGKD